VPRVPKLAAAGRRRPVRLLAIALLAAACGPRPVRVEPASVIFVLIDTLRADHLGAYGYERDTSPAIDRLAAESLLFEQARSVAPWTNPTIASIFTGRRPNEILEPKRHAEAIQTPLPAELPTLAEKLAAGGARTLAFVDHAGISPGRGYARGFETFVRLYQVAGAPVWGLTDGAVVIREIDRHLADVAGERIFLYLHLVYPHRPYDPPPSHDGRFGPTTRETRREHRDEMINAYDAEIRYTDDVVAELRATLERHDRLDDSWLILTSDHGEGFWEHGWSEHGNTLFDELLHVPLVVRPPVAAGIEPRAIATPVSLGDLHATVLELAAGTGAAAPEVRERSLLRFLEPLREAPDAPIVAQQPHSGDVHGAALIEDGWKLIRRHERRRAIHLRDLANDPAELAEVADANPEVARRLDRALRRLLAEDNRSRATLADRAPAPLDAEETERLRALGYLN
jgi:arylsulfatase A-like enzyme